MTDQVSLSAAARSNLLSLQSTSGQLKTAETDLSTGKVVNNATDNATAYFASQGFLQTAGAFGQISDQLSSALETVQSATDAITSIQNVVSELQGLTTSALGTTNTTLTLGYAKQYNALLTQLSSLVNDAQFNGTNLLNSTSNSLVVNFDSATGTALTITGVDLTADGGTLSLGSAVGSWGTSADVTSAVNLLSSALTTIQQDAASFGDNATLISTRQGFTSSLINDLQTASDNLTLADNNQLGAEINTLQTQSELGVDALSITSQASQYVLKLFG